MANDQSRPRPRNRAEAEASDLAYWELFLKGYYNNDPEYKELLSDSLGLNRKTRRKLESKTRRLRAKAGR